MVSGDINTIMWGPSPEVHYLERRQRLLPWRKSARRRLRGQLDEALGTPYDDARGALLGLISESDLRAYEARRAAKWWRRTYYFLGLPAAVLASIAAVTGLASTAGRIPAAIIALVAAGLSSAATFLNSDQRGGASEAASAAWQDLADDSRMKMVDLDRHLLNQQAIGQTLLRLHRRKSRLMRGDLTLDQDPEGAAGG